MYKIKKISWIKYLSFTFDVSYYMMMQKLNTKLLTITNPFETRQLIVFDGDYFTTLLEKFQDYELPFREIAQKILKEGDFALDVGANLGYHTITMANLVGNTGTVVAIEPQRIVFQQLCGNISLAGLDNVQCHNIAVGNEIATVFLERANYYHVGKWPNVTNIGNISLTGYPDSGEKVQQLMLDNFRFEKLKLIKMDIQGSEFFALEGAMKNINEHLPYIFIEIEENQLRKFSLTSHQLIEFIKSAGYDLYRIHTFADNFTTDDYLCVPVRKNNIDIVTCSYQSFKFIKI